jgi:tetratricopeptide (TPR) repeat protein
MDAVYPGSDEKPYSSRLLFDRTSETMSSIGPLIGEKSAAGAVARGKMFELVGYFANAIAAYQEALFLDEGLDEARARLALAQLKLGLQGHSDDTHRGLATITELAEKKPDYGIRALASDADVSAMTVLGDALALSKRIDDAKAAYGKAVEINEGDTYAALRLRQVQQRLINGDMPGPPLPGRPVTVDGEVQMAPVVIGESAWCVR